MSAEGKLLLKAFRDGGFTVNPITLEILSETSGYMVSSGNVPEIKLEPGCSILADFKRALGNIRNHIGNAPNWYIGCWLEKTENGDRLVIDASEHIQGLERALTSAKARKQRAIFKLKTGEVLPMSTKHNVS